jgi:hypothetical protein
MKKYIYLLIMFLVGCADAEPDPVPSGVHGALYVRSIELSDQPRFKYVVVVATADDEGNGMDANSAGYSFYTNAELSVGQQIVADTTVPYVPTVNGKPIEPAETEPETESGVDSATIAPADSGSFKIGDTVLTTKIPK